MAAPDTVVRLDEKFAAFGDHWMPRIVGEINDMHLKVVKLKGEFVWHTHHDADELFFVRKGYMTIRLRGREEVAIGPDEFFIVPRGVEHCPVAEEECEVLLLESAGLVNTGDDTDTVRTAPVDAWI